MKTGAFVGMFNPAIFAVYSVIEKINTGTAGSIIDDDLCGIIMMGASK